MIPERASSQRLACANHGPSGCSVWGTLIPTSIKECSRQGITPSSLLIFFGETDDSFYFGDCHTEHDYRMGQLGLGSGALDKILWISS